MTNFYCITDAGYKDSWKRCAPLEEVCKKRRIKFIKVVAEDFDYLADKPKRGSLIYRATPGDRSRVVEKHILNSSIASFYTNYKFGIYDRGSKSFIYNEKANLPSIKTIHDVSNREKLVDYADSLGGFPVIVKILGGTHGIGVIRVDSKESLLSLADFLNKEGIYAIMRQYIKHRKQARLVVLGNEVIASHINFSSFDFRTNVGKNIHRKRESFVFPKKIQDIAIKAVKSCELEFGGVDILFEEETNEPHIAEINFPFYFPTTQKLTGVDIAGKMIDYLMEKSKKQK